MPLSNQTVIQMYSGNGSTDDFSITQDILVNDSSELKVYLRDNTDPENVTEELQTEGAMQDYVLTGANPPSQPFDDTVHFNTPPTADQVVIIVRELPLTQPQNIDANSAFPAVATTKNLDRIVAMIQQLNARFKKVAQFAGWGNTDFPDGIIVPNPEPTNLLRWNVAGDGLENISPSALAAEGGSGLPVGGDAFSLAEKISPTDGDAGWTDPIVYQGFSERYSQLVDLEGIKAVLDYIMDMGYAPPTVSLGTNPNYATIREKGDTITSVDLTATIVKVLDDVGEVRFYRGVTLISTQTSGGGIPDGGNSTYTDANSFSDNRTYSVQVDDVSAQSKPSATSTRNFIFVYPYYYGVGAAGLGAAVDTLTKQIIQETTNTVRNFTVNGSQKMYFAYPASYGNLTHIYDINNFDTIADWTKTTTNITGLDGNAVSYNIYEFNNFAVAGSYQYTFQQ